MLRTVSAWTWLGVSLPPTCSASCSWNTLATSLPSLSAAWRSCCMNTATLPSTIMKVQTTQLWLVVIGRRSRNQLSKPPPPAEMEKWRSPEFYEREVHRMQLPFSGKLPGGSVSAEEKQERRAQQLRRLQEINARRREEKLLQDQERLDRLMAVQAGNFLSYFQFIVKVDSLGQGWKIYHQATAPVKSCFVDSFKITLKELQIGVLFSWSCCWSTNPPLLLK